MLNTQRSLVKEHQGLLLPLQQVPLNNVAQENYILLLVRVDYATLLFEFQHY